MRGLFGLAMVMMLLAAPTAHATCTVSASGVAFGEYLGVKTQSTGTVTVNCNAGTAAYTFTIALSTGAGTYAQRKMSNGTGTLDYQLFRQAYTSTWGDGTGGSNTVAGSIPAAGGAETFNVYGGIPVATPTGGVYTDLITATVTGTGTGTPTTQFVVTALVKPACTVSANPLNFGIYTGVALSATTTLAVICTNTTPYYVNLNNGQNYACCWYNRMIGPGGQLLSYELYQDAAHTVPWWDTVNSDGQAGTGTGQTQSLTVYGLTFAQGNALQNANVTPGAYVDTVTVTLTY
jgi:spore coat protein U-like protein